MTTRDKTLKYTRGYWERRKTIIGKEFLIRKGNDDIALVRKEADAKIIAQAPLMYGLLCRLEEYLSDEANDGNIRAHIALKQVKNVIGRVHGNVKEAAR